MCAHVSFKAETGTPTARFRDCLLYLCVRVCVWAGIILPNQLGSGQHLGTKEEDDNRHQTNSTAAAQQEEEEEEEEERETCFSFNCFIAGEKQWNNWTKKDKTHQKKKNHNNRNSIF